MSDTLTITPEDIKILSAQLHHLTMNWSDYTGTSMVRDVRCPALVMARQALDSLYMQTCWPDHYDKFGNSLD